MAVLLRHTAVDGHALIPDRAKTLTDEDCGRDRATGMVRRPRCVATSIATGERCHNAARYVDELNARRKYCPTHARIELAEPTRTTARRKKGLRR